jgi:hypothetical protein
LEGGGRAGSKATDTVRVFLDPTQHSGRAFLMRNIPGDGVNPVDHRDDDAATSRDPRRAPRQGIGRYHDGHLRGTPDRRGNWCAAGDALWRGSVPVGVGGWLCNAVPGAIYLASAAAGPSAGAGLTRTHQVQASPGGGDAQPI